jgi:four helix bundle protein
MGLIIQQRALQAAGGLRQVLPVVRKRDRSLFDQIHRAMNSVVLNIAEADGNDAGTARARFASACGSAKEVRAGLQLAVAYGYVPTTKVNAVDIALDEVCAMSWRLSGRESRFRSVRQSLTHHVPMLPPYVDFYTGERRRTARDGQHSDWVGA